MTTLRLIAILLIGLLSACGGGGGGGGGGGDPPLPPPVAIDPATFLNTLVCPDGTLAVLNPACPAQVARGSTPVVTWRYDWAHADQAQVQVTYQLDDGSGWPATFNYPPHLGFYAPNGDGGDVYVYDGTNVRISYTQNGDGKGGTVAGWWVGSRCGGTGWLSFDKYTSDAGWRNWTARLRGSTTSPYDCPSLDTAYTRARVVRQLPTYFILQAPDGTITTQTVPLDSIVTEHYAGSSIAGASSMERQVHVAGVGPSVFWEAWVRNPPTAPPTYQCDGVPGGWSGPPPGAGWVLWDRRCRTVVRYANPVLTGTQWGWPPANATQ